MTEGEHYKSDNDNLMTTSLKTLSPWIFADSLDPPLV